MAAHTASVTLRIKWYVRPLLYMAVVLAFISEQIRALAHRGMVPDVKRKP